MTRFLCAATTALVIFVTTVQAHAQEHEADLAKQLANPVSSLISVPFQGNYDCCYGPADGARFTLNVQPVIPVSISTDWNMIVRTIVPVISQEETTVGGDDEFGLGDVVQSFFFSPKAPRNGVTWAVGPVLLYPTGSAAFSAEKWGGGPTALVLKQQGHTTFGVLANHIWSVAGEDGRPDVSSTFLQPFFNYTWPSSTSLAITAETTYDWKTGQWNVPLIAGVTHVFKFGEQRVQMGLQGKAYLDHPDGAADWGVRANVTLLFPKK